MRVVILEVQTPRGAWCFETSTRFPGLRICVHNHFPLGEGRSLEVVTLQGAEAQEALALIGTNPRVEACELLDRRERSLTLKLTLRGCALPKAVHESGVVPSMPYDLTLGSHRWLILGQEREITKFVAVFEREGLGVRVLYAGDYRDGEGLTSRQRQVLEHAVASGYYGYPRRTTLSDLARELNVSKATVCESLMAIESTIMLRAVAGPP
ncbi:MAG TPA: helix-turn-helix domain-containing protein [Candidatus Thermoplasmatota archaeon]|nr:helix-turn-helix domain-containing protein [Candidatus Thermoplasmatota archaeon]